MISLDMTIFLMRHSESEDDLNNSYGGMADWSLTSGGAETVKSYQKTFEALGVKKIYSSPLRRALCSAKLLNENTKVPLEVVFELHETPHYGYMTGLEKGLAKRLFAYLLEKSEYKDKAIGYYHRNCWPGGELPDELDKRVECAISHILQDAKSRSGGKSIAVAVMAHGGVIRSVFWNLLNNKRKIVDIKDMAVAEISYKNGKFKLHETSGFTFAG